MSSPEFKMIMRRLARIEGKIMPTAGKWVSEAEAMRMTGLSRTTLYAKRKDATFNWSSATGRKIKYLRKDLENYIEKNSTL